MRPTTCRAPRAAASGSGWYAGGPGRDVDNVAPFTTGDGAVGYGLFEVMTVCPHAQYFTGWDDLA